jgi:flagellar biosynthetic protein FliQ
MFADQTVIESIRVMLMITLKIVLPILAAGVVLGLVISIIQAVTSIQDQTLSFVPKLIVMLAMLIVLLPWIAARLADFAREMFTLS